MLNIQWMIALLIDHNIECETRIARKKIQNIYDFGSCQNLNKFSIQIENNDRNLSNEPKTDYVIIKLAGLSDIQIESTKERKEKKKILERVIADLKCQCIRSLFVSFMCTVLCSIRLINYRWSVNHKPLHRNCMPFLPVSLILLYLYEKSHTRPKHWSFRVTEHIHHRKHRALYIVYVFIYVSKWNTNHKRKKKKGRKWDTQHRNTM